MVEENRMYQNLQKFVGREFASKKFFVQIWAKFPSLPKKLPAPTPVAQQHQYEFFSAWFGLLQEKGFGLLVLLYCKTGSILCLARLVA